ncbi:MAG: hypothetical protein K2Q09_04845, partial [Phycisphaerales bacterium]|nr:hypothetical protein [Phycisphaerales bacterium]
MAKLHPIDAETPWQRTWRRRSAIAARSIGCAVVFIGLLGLTGWWAGIGVLRTVLPGLAQMKPNVGAALVLAGGGLSLGVFGVRRRRVRIALGALGALIGAATLVEYALGLGDVIDSLLVPGVAPRMTAASAVALTVGGCGVVLTALPSRAGPAPVRAGVETALAALVMVTGTLGLLGYLYGAGPMYHTKAFSSMALHTALALTLLGTGLVLCKPTQGLARLLGSEGAGGVFARRLIGFFVLLTPVLGWVRLKGEDLGFYDTPFGLALMLAMTMVVGIAMVWWTAGALDRTDAWRATLQEDLAASVSREHATAAQRGAILNGLPAAVALLGPDGRVAAVNQRWESVLVDPDQRAGVVGSCFADWGGNALG